MRCCTKPGSRLPRWPLLEPEPHTWPSSYTKGRSCCSPSLLTIGFFIPRQPGWGSWILTFNLSALTCLICRLSLRQLRAWTLLCHSCSLQSGRHGSGGSIKWTRPSVSSRLSSKFVQSFCSSTVPRLPRCRLNTWIMMLGSLQQRARPGPTAVPPAAPSSCSGSTCVCTWREPMGSLVLPDTSP